MLEMLLLTLASLLAHLYTSNGEMVGRKILANSEICTCVLSGLGGLAVSCLFHFFHNKKEGEQKCSHNCIRVQRPFHQFTNHGGI